MGHSVREHTLKISPFQPLRSALSSLLDVLKTPTLCCIFSQMIMVGTESESYTIPYCTVPPPPHLLQSRNRCELLRPRILPQCWIVQWPSDAAAPSPVALGSSQPDLTKKATSRGWKWRGRHECPEEEIRNSIVSDTGGKSSDPLPHPSVAAGDGGTDGTRETSGSVLQEPFAILTGGLARAPPGATCMLS